MHKLSTCIRELATTQSINRLESDMSEREIEIDIILTRYSHIPFIK